VVVVLSLRAAMKPRAPPLLGEETDQTDSVPSPPVDRRAEHGSGQRPAAREWVPQASRPRMAPTNTDLTRPLMHCHTNKIVLLVLKVRELRHFINGPGTFKESSIETVAEIGGATSARTASSCARWRYPTTQGTIYLF
jgi:hypothetical protein